MCKAEMKPGIVKFGHAWAIPTDAKRHNDHRIKSGKYIKSHFERNNYV